MKDKTAERNKAVPKFVYWIIIAIFLFSFLFVIPGPLRARISSGLASHRARSRLESISLPPEMRVIEIYETVYITSSSCYMGEAYLLGSTALDEKGVERFYDDFFSNWDWRIKKYDTPAYPRFTVYNPGKTGFERPIEGISISKCDEECVSSHDFSRATINDALESHDSIYLIRAWFEPYEVRYNLCWCCSGG
jgi:hypothetical protein